MQRSALLLLVACAAVMTTTVSAADPAEAIVRSQDLLNVRKAGITALWTRREGSYTLQLVMPVVLPARNSMSKPALRNTEAATLEPVDVRGVRIKAPVTSQATGIPGLTAAPLPQLQVWLLGPNGAEILPSMRGGPFPAVCNLRCQAQDLLFRFSIPDGQQAVAAAIRVGDEFYIEKLHSLELTKVSNTFVE